MSALVYPSNLPGIQFGSTRTPLFKTRIREAVSGKESRIALQVYPRYRFELKYEFLRHDAAVSDLQAIAGLYEEMQGQADTFLYSDPNYSAVTAMQFGTGNGVTTAFQLTATFRNAGGPGRAQLVQSLNGSPQIYLDGVLQASGYTIGPTGLVTFTVAPGAGVVLTWTGAFYYRCRFDMEDLTVEQFMRHLWTVKRVILKQVKL